MLARDSERLPQEISDHLLATYGIEQRHIGRWQLGWIEDRLCLPVFDPQGETCGVNLRSFSGAFPKAKLHTEEDSMAWYPKLGSKQLIIVEDQLSAIRAADYVNAVALLGTNLNDERATRIRKETPGYERYLALDQDAFDKAVKLTVQHRGLLGLRLLTLTKDLKDLTNEELTAFMFTNCGS
jgi:DNA primase